MTQSSPTTPLTGPASAIGPGVEAISHASLRTSTYAPQTLAARCADSLGLYALLAPTFVLLAIFSLVPFVIAIGTSFFDYEVGGEAKFVGLANYVEYARDYTFLQSFGNMLF